MRFFTAFTTFGLIAFVAAQNATTTASAETTESSVATSTGSSSAAATASLSPQVKCLQSCGSADVCCQAKCVGVPCPSQLQANATTECAAQCPQGNGTAGETQQYASCQAACISSYFLTASSTAVPTASQTDGSSSATATFGQTNAATTDGSASATEGSSATGASASASPTQSGNGADNLHVGSVGLGFLALVMVGLAL
ncbi:uncharacterized protein A1O5_06845 [Cladophialophora psammophila CBS 110553]|uniref:Extracellular membrane protein CFEM domain-containing protein n=1 Tax=Cladophialophora psammophila CBS 110553 TaxID=1182543 RepID=W9XHD4_9EURO|nr:uncharacterized protein A1O5_06845 [Cladophialophora psammophila CBS 110553]EXJ69774.1 hypothetical protein A1O5_06845 [Cladophialophora psammophila CBS 110553]